MTDVHLLLQALAIEGVVGGIAAAAIIFSVLAAFKPVFAWPINTDTFLKFVAEALEGGDEDRARSVTELATRAHVAILVKTWLDGNDVQSKHRELATQRRMHFVKLAIVGLFVTGVVAVTILGWSMGKTETGLIVASAISLPTITYAIYSNARLGSDCKRVVEKELDRLASLRESQSAW